MVSRLGCTWLLCAALGGAAAAVVAAPAAPAEHVVAPNPPWYGQDDAYDDGSSLDKRPYRKGVVTTVRNETGPRSDACAAFVIDRAMVREFFAKATQISAHDYLHEHTWSGCNAKGTLTFRDGRRGHWVVQQQGLGLLTLGGKKHYFVCEACRLTGLGAVDPVDAQRQQMSPH